MSTLYTNNIIRTEIIQTTNPSSVWETGSVWRSFQIFSSGKPSAKQASRMQELICGLRVRQRPEKQNKKDVFTLTNTLCLVLPCDTRAKCCGIACSHTIHLSRLPATWGYLSCLWRMALGSPPKGGLLARGSNHRVCFKANKFKKVKQDLLNFFHHIKAK